MKAKISVKGMGLFVGLLWSVWGLSSQCWADQALATAKNCKACHEMDKKKIGPAYRDIARKYNGDPKMVEVLAQKIVQGGGGVWGSIPMVANTHVSPDDAKKLAGWILTVK